MKNSQKWILAGLFATSLSMAFADQAKDTKMNNGNMQPSGMSREITPQASPIASEGARFFFSGDFIYWQPKMDNVIIGYTGEADTLESPVVPGDTYPTAPTTPGVIQGINFGYQPGFKFGAGLVFAHDGWDTFVNYTWIDSAQQTATLNRTATNGLLQSFYINQQNTLSFGNSVSGTWSFYFNEIDWELGRKFFISKRLTLRPHMGLKGAWMHQNLILAELGSNNGSLAPSAAHLVTATTYERQKFWGIGFRGGLNTEWHFSRDFSIYGNLALTEIYGLMHLKVTSDVVDPAAAQTAGSGFTGTYRYLRENQHTLKPVLEMAMGFRYETSFGDDNYYRFLLQAGWEQQVWWDQNQFIKMVNVGSAGDNNLVFQGLDVKVGFCF